jgi:hypothetical protein
MLQYRREKATMPEQVIYADANARITSSLATIEETSYPIASIASLRVEQDKPTSAYIYAAGITVVIGLVAGGWFTVIMLAIACMLAGAAFALRPDVLVIVTLGGERAAFQSRNSAYVRQLRAALERAIATRARATVSELAGAPHVAEGSTRLVFPGPIGTKAPAGRA